MKFFKKQGIAKKIQRSFLLFVLLSILSSILFLLFFILEEHQEKRMRTFTEKSQIFNNYVDSLNQAIMGTLLARREDYIKGVLLIKQAQKNIYRYHRQYSGKKSYFELNTMHIIGNNLSRHLVRYLKLLKENHQNPNDKTIKINLSRTLNAIISLTESIKIRQALFKDRSLETIRKQKQFENIIYVFIWAMVILIFLLTIFLTLYFTKKNTKLIIDPINKLIDATKLISSGQFDLSNIPKSADEIGMLGNAFSDMTHRLEKTQSDLKKAASIDALTQLPNRRFLTEYFDRALSRSKRFDLELVLLLLGVDNFKNINELYGHEFGDQLLIQIGKRITSTLRKEDFLSRVGGDEFTVILVDIKGPSEALVVAQKIIDAMKKSFTISSIEVVVTISLGISHFPADGDTTEVLYRNADIALTQAKQKGKNNYQYFTQELNREMLRNLSLSNEIQSSVKNQELYLVYQPIIDLASKKMIGAEALMRWNHPIRGAVPPNEFIPIAENTGFMIEMGNWLVKNVCNQIDAWLKAEYKGFYIAINLSPLQINTAVKVKSLIKSIGMKYSAKLSGIPIKFELTESGIIQDEKNILNALTKINENKNEILIDDFGTGYSSLSRLSVLPVSTIKIDKSLIDNLPTKPESVKIVKSIIVLVGGLNLEVIAEGIETQEQCKFLIKNGCKNGQGFLFYKPLKVKDFEKLLARMFHEES